MIETLTAIRLLVLVAALAVLLYAGKARHVRCGTGWLFVTLGFGAVAVGSFIQLGAYIPAFHVYRLFANAEINKIVAEVCGFYLGITLVAIGLWKIGPTLYNFYISEEKLARSNQNFQTIVNTSIEGIVIVQDGRIVFANPSLEVMLGVPLEDLIGSRAIEHIVPADRERVYTRRDQILDHKEQKSINEYKLIRKDGEIRSALISSQYINWQGEDAFLSILSDITELKQAEENLSAIANTAAEAIGIFQDERLVYCNPAMIHIFGYTLEELQSRPFYEFFHPEDRELLQARYSARQAGEAVPKQYDYRLLNKSGDDIWVMISAGITNWKGRVATVTVLTDVTARKRGEEEIRLAKESLELRVEERTKDLRLINDQLLAISNQKSAFVSAASHELRTPLASILGFSALVGKILNRHLAPAVSGDKVLKEKVGLALNNLEIIKAEGGRLTRLLDDMLDVSKIEAGRMDWRDTPLDILPLVETAVIGARVKLEGKAVTLDVVSGDGQNTVFADHDRIMQVFTNLLDNAVKFTEEGSILVSVSQVRAGMVEFRVTDTGLGMSDQERGLAFQKYYQAESRSRGISKAPRGTGLGLAICKEIVEHYQGLIGVEAGPEGSGSSFFVRLPLSVGEGEA